MNASHAAALCSALMSLLITPPAPARPPVGGTELFRLDCAQPRPPRQYEVARALGQPNAGQAYQTRQRLMAEARRACQRPGVQTVVVQRGPAADPLARPGWARQP